MVVWSTCWSTLTSDWPNGPHLGHGLALKTEAIQGVGTWGMGSKYHSVVVVWRPWSGGVEALRLRGLLDSLAQILAADGRLGDLRLELFRIRETIRYWWPQT